MLIVIGLKDIYKKKVGLGKTSIDDLQLILESNDRGKAGRAVPPEGLYLQEVIYPSDIYLD